MKSLKLSAFLIILSTSVFSQQIYIGQNANEANQIISAEVQSNQRAQGYNQVSMQFEPHYNNGQLDDIILCKENVPMIDLHRTADFCTHYVINRNRISYILTEYSNVSIQELESVMDKNMIRVGDYYFGTSDNYVWFHLMKTGEVAKVYRNKSLNPPPVNILKQLRIINQPDIASKNSNDNNHEIHFNIPVDPEKYIDPNTLPVLHDKDFSKIIFTSNGVLYKIPGRKFTSDNSLIWTLTLTLVGFNLSNSSGLTVDYKILTGMYNTDLKSTELGLSDYTSKLSHKLYISWSNSLQQYTILLKSLDDSQEFQFQNTQASAKYNLKGSLYK